MEPCKDTPPTPPEKEPEKTSETIAELTYMSRFLQGQHLAIEGRVYRLEKTTELLLTAFEIISLGLLIYAVWPYLEKHYFPKPAEIPGVET